MTKQDSQTSSSVYELSPIPLGNKGYRWAKLINDVLTADYLQQLTTAIQEHSSLPDLITLQLYEHLAKIYKHKVALTVEKEGIEALDLNQSHFRLLKETDGKTEPRQSVDVHLDEPSIQDHLKEALLLFFERQDFQDEFIKAIGSNLVVWAFEVIESEQKETCNKLLCKEIENSK